MSITIYSNAGVQLSVSQNLRGIIDRNRRDRAVRVEVSPRPTGRGEFFIRWANGDWACTFFESYTVAVEFAKNKRFAQASVETNATTTETPL